MNPLKTSEAQKQAENSGILGNAHRIQIVWILGNRELTVSEISEEINTSMQNTSQHLRLMKNKGVLGSKRDGIGQTRPPVLCIFPLFHHNTIISIFNRYNVFHNKSQLFSPIHYNKID